MPDIANAESRPAQQAAPQPYRPIRALLRAGKNDEAIVALCALAVTRPGDLLVKELLFDAFFQKRDWLPVVRDHVLHSELMIGCLWAGRTDCGIDIVDLMRRYFAGQPTARYGHDQFMLGRMLWPLIRGRALVHDKYYRLPGVHTVPLTDPKNHFGAGHQNIGRVLAEAEQLGIPRVL